MGASALWRWLRVWLGLVLWLGTAVGAGRAQGLVDGTAQGELRDAHGVPVAGAMVRLLVGGTRAGPSQAMLRMTDQHGDFAFLGLPAGEYLVSVRLPMSPVWVRGPSVRTAPGQAVEWTLRLREAATGLVLAVEPADSAMDAETVERQGATSSVAGAGALSRMDLLPVPDREWEASAAVSSAVRDATLADGGAAQNPDEEQATASSREERETGSAASGLSVDGLAVTGNVSSVDGLSADQGFRGGPRGTATGSSRAGSSFAQGGVRALRATARNYSAQAGGAAGGGLVVATRGIEARGRAGLHGDAFMQAREAAWDAVNPFAVVTTYGAGRVQAALVRPADNDVQFGGAVGAPVRVPGLGEHWRAGLFGAIEVRERQQSLFSSPETAGFYQLSATQRALLANRGVTGSEIAAALGYLSGLSGPEQLRGMQWLSFGRVNLAPTGTDRLSLSYQGLRSGMPTNGGGQVADGVVNRGIGSVGTSSIQLNAGTVRWVHLFGPRWTNELRGQLARDVEAEAPGPGNAAEPGIGPGGYAPQVTIGPQGFSYGTPASLGRLAYPDERRVDVADTSVWRFGKHLLSVGGSWSRLDDRVVGATNLQGSFLYESGSTNGHAGGLVDWITDYTFNVHAYPNGGCPSISAKEHFFCFRSYSQSFANVETEFDTHEIAGFAEDALRLRPNLRLTLGARWEYQLLPFPLAPNAELDAALLNAGVLSTAAYGSTASLPEDRNNVGPRVAVVWSPGSKGGARRGAWMTVQAGYGIFFGRLPGATLNAALTDTGTVHSTTSIRITPSVETDCPQVANQGFGYPCAFLYAPVGVAPVAQTASVTLFAKHFRLPVIQRGSLAIERELGRVLLRAEYAGAWAVQLPETTDLNIAPSTGTVNYVLQGGESQRGLWSGQSFQVPLYTARRTTKFGPVTAIVSNANATYHSGTAEAQLRPWHGWGGRAGFTFSKALDYGPLLGATPRQDGQFDPFTDGYDKARSSLDRPWQAAGAVTYRSTVESGGEWTRRLLGGWGLAALGRAGSGAPYSYVVFGGTRLQGGHESINGSGGATYLPTVGRNTLRLPMRSKLDMRASREVRFGRRGGREWRAQLRADAFNVFNTVSLSRVETRAFLLGDATSVGGMTPLIFQDAAAVAAEGVSTPAFGTPLSSTSGLSRERTMELGLRLNF